MDKAARNGHFEVVKFLHENRTEGCKNAMNFASRHGHFEVVKFLHQNVRTEGNVLEAFKLASDNFHVDIVNFLREEHPELIN